MKINQDRIRTSFGTDHDGQYVQAKGYGVIARHWGGTYVELLAGPKPTSFHALHVSYEGYQDLSEELVANELAEFLEDTTAAEMSDYISSAGI